MADIKQVNKSSDSKDKAAELAALIKMDVATVRAAQLDEESLSTLFNMAVNHKRVMDYFVRPTGYLAIVGLVTSFMVTKSVQDMIMGPAVICALNYCLGVAYVDKSPYVKEEIRRKALDNAAAPYRQPPAP